jgi:LssY C-terminus
VYAGQGKLTTVLATGGVGLRNRGFVASRMAGTLLRVKTSCCGAVLAGAVLLLSVAPTASANCESVPAGKSFWVRLLDPIASYSSKPGTSIRAILIQSPECNLLPVFPAGLEVDGHIVGIRRVGMGLKHETAMIQLSFDTLVTPSGEVLKIQAQVAEIDNARETVSSNGVIHGVNATNTPQGRITSRLIHLPTYNPYSDMGLVVYRAVTVLPEPEIYLPPSTDLRLRLVHPLDVADQPELPHPSLQMDEYERADVEALVEQVPVRTQTSYGKDADLVNLAFVGSEEQLQGAFAAAGWQKADPNSKNAFLKEFAAFLTFTSYPTMPISRQYLNGEVQDYTWQKSFDSYGKREHLRVWEEPQMVEGQPAWLGAYTRETSAALSVKYHKFIHHVERNVDEGANMLVRDLTLSGCVDSVRLLPRSNVPQLMMNATGDELRTDGMLTVVHLKNCNRPQIEYTRANPLIPIRPRSAVVRYIRNQVLLYKSDVIRGNVIYGAFDLCRMSIHSFRHRHDGTLEDDGQPLSPTSPETLLPTPTLMGSGYTPSADR